MSLIHFKYSERRVVKKLRRKRQTRSQRFTKKRIATIKVVGDVDIRTYRVFCLHGLDSDGEEYGPERVHRRDRSNKSALHYCSGQRDLVAAASVAVAAPDLLESADEDGFTPLHLAVIQGNLAMVNLLLANRADVNALDNEGHSVVHWATVCGEVEALRAVLTAGANVTTPDINGGSPLHYAAQMCGANYEGKLGQASSKLALEILSILLSHPYSSVDVTDKDGRQPLLWAASAGSEKAVLALVKAGGRVESADKDGLTALHCAASRGHTECIDTLISLCGAPTDLIDSNGCTALHYAVTLGHADATSRLLDLEADPNRQDRKGRTPAHCGCAKGQFETVKLLKERGANLWLRNAKGDLPVHEAAASGRRELVEWLLEQKPKQINTTSNDGRTLLHIASGNDYTDMCKMLLDFGADINCIFRNSKGVVMTPIDCSLQKGYRSTAKFLQSNGGLPASKLRLSGRRPNAFNDQELVKPLKYTEKEEIHDLQSSKKYVVYVKKSDTDSAECSCTDKTQKKERSTSHVCRHHRKKFRRRTSSCGEADEKYKDESSDICRSKSNLEIRRKKSKERTFSTDEEDDDDSCEHCCRHKKKLKLRRKDRSKRRSREVLDSDLEMEERYSRKERRSKRSEHTERTRFASDDEDLSAIENGKHAHISSRKRPQSAKKRSKEGTFIKSPPSELKVTPTAAVDLTDEDEIPKSETVVTQVEVHKVDEPPEMVGDELKEQVTEEVSKKIDEVLEDAAKVVEKIVDESKPEESQEAENVEAEVVVEEPAPVEEAPAAEPDVTEPTEPPPEEVQEEPAPVEPPVEAVAEEVVEQPVEVEEEVEEEKVPEIAEEPPAEILPELQVEQKEDEPAETVIESPPTMETEATQTEPEVQEITLPDAPQESRRSFTLLPDSPEEGTSGRKSSFTVLKSDDSVDVDEALEHLHEEDQEQQETSFQVITGKVQQPQSDAEYTASTDEEVEVDEEGNQFARHSAQGASGIEYNGRKRRLKKRVKNGEKPRIWKTDGTQQASKDQDSGFEPSPRAMKTKIPSPRTIHTAYLPRKPIYATLDGRSCSSRVEGRKPGDKAACNMSAVTRSIQRNIRRYYMERKIFQHLLELKSLQIRSSKLNESMLVKRAVDDYHKSCIALGAETGGTLRRYPYTEYSFKNFEMFLYDTLKSIQKPGTYNFQNINEVYEEAERRLSPDYNAYEKALQCTTKTHRCLHAAHAYTGIPCAAYIPMMNHHTMPKLGFGPYKKTGVGSFYLPKILTSQGKGGSKVSLELSHGKNKQLISLPSDKLDSNKRYYVTFTVKGSENDVKSVPPDSAAEDPERK